MNHSAENGENTENTCLSLKAPEVKTELALAPKLNARRTRQRRDSKSETQLQEDVYKDLRGEKPKRGSRATQRTPVSKDTALFTPPPLEGDGGRAGHAQPPTLPPEKEEGLEADVENVPDQGLPAGWGQEFQVDDLKNQRGEKPSTAEDKDVQSLPGVKLDGGNALFTQTQPKRDGRRVLPDSQATPATEEEAEPEAGAGLGSVPEEEQVKSQSSVRGGDPGALIDFLKHFEQQSHGSGIVQPELLSVWDCPSRMLNQFKDNVQVWKRGNFAYVQKKEEWIKARRRPLHFEIALGYQMEGIVKVLGVIKSVEGGVDWIGFLLEYCEGDSLARKRKQADWNIQDADVTVRRIIEITEALQNRGICNSDLKPENICFRLENDSSSVCFIDLESLIPPGGVNYRYTAAYSAPFDLKLTGDPSKDKRQIILWHQWSVGVIICTILPPFLVPWRDKIEEFKKDASKLRTWTKSHPKEVRQYLPSQDPCNDQWRDGRASLEQLRICAQGLLDLSPPLSLEECRGFTAFTEKENVRLALKDGPSDEWLGALQVAVGTPGKKLLQMDRFQALVKKCRGGQGYRLKRGEWNFNPFTYKAFSPEALTVWPPL